MKNLFMSFMEIGVLALFSAALGMASVKLYLALPDAWLCDFGEEAQKKHSPLERCGKTARKRQFTAFLLSVFSFFLLCVQSQMWKSLSAGRQESILSATDFVPVFLGIAVSFLVLAVTALSDLEYKIVPDQAVAALFVLSAAKILFNAENGKQSFLSAILGMLTAGGLMLLAAVLAFLFKGDGALGFGDVKLMAGCGALVGIDGAMPLYVLTAIPSALYFAAGLLLRRFDASSAHPLAPWIAAAAMFCLAIPGLSC